jgi:hypothetical protein
LTTARRKKRVYATHIWQRVLFHSSSSRIAVNHVHEDGGYCLEEPVWPKCLQSAARRKINMEPVPWTRCLVTFTYIFIQPAAFFSSRPVAKSTRIIIIIRERGLGSLARSPAQHLCEMNSPLPPSSPPPPMLLWESGADRLYSVCVLCFACCSNK